MRAMEGAARLRMASSFSAHTGRVSHAAMCILPRRISVKALTDKTNVPLMAGEIVEKCKLIHPSKVGGYQRM